MEPLSLGHKWEVIVKDVITVADPGFPVGGRQLPRQLCFKKFVRQNERIWTLRGGAPAVPPGSANVLYYSD